jgi:hypothetical protein
MGEAETNGEIRFESVDRKEMAAESKWDKLFEMLKNAPKDKVVRISIEGRSLASTRASLKANAVKRGMTLATKQSSDGKSLYIWMRA